MNSLPGSAFLLTMLAALFSSTAASDFSERQQTITGQVSDGSPKVYVTLKGDAAASGCERAYLVDVTYPANASPDTPGTFSQAVRYFPGKNTVTVHSSTAQKATPVSYKIAEPALRVRLDWAGNDHDYDLYVNDLNYTRTSTSEGKLDRDAYAGSDDTGPGVENITFPKAAPGTYKVYVNYYSSHGNGGADPTTVTIYVAGRAVFTATHTITDPRGHGSSLAGDGLSVWSVATVVIHGQEAGGYRVVDDSWNGAMRGLRDMFIGSDGTPIVQRDGKPCIFPETDYRVSSLHGPNGTGRVVIAKGQSAQFSADGTVNTAGTIESCSILGKFHSSDSGVASIDELGVLTGLTGGKTSITVDGGGSAIDVYVVDLQMVADTNRDGSIDVEKDRPLKEVISRDRGAIYTINRNAIVYDSQGKAISEDNAIESAAELKKIAPIRIAKTGTVLPSGASLFLKVAGSEQIGAFHFFKKREVGESGIWGGVTSSGGSRELEIDATSWISDSMDTNAGIEGIRSLDDETSKDFKGKIAVSYELRDNGHVIASDPLSLGVFKPNIVPSVPKFVECLHKRSGKADEPVIVMTSGGDKSVSNCSLSGYEEGGRNVWSLSAKYDYPVFENDRGVYAVVWDLDGGQITAGSAGSGTSSGSDAITVKYAAGQHRPTLKIYRTLDGQTALVGTASIHDICVYNASVDGTGWTAASIAEDDRYGSETKLERKIDEGVDINVQVGVDGKAQGSSRVRVSPDGYPQNEYWVTSGDNGDLPQPYAFKPQSAAKAWVQGYGDPSSNVDDLSVRIKASKDYEDDTTKATFTAVFLEGGVDGDRDGTISFDDADHTSMMNPYRFWINEDHDALVKNQSQPGASPLFYDEEDDTTGAPDSSDNYITCPRDLEDFTRIHLRWKQLTIAESGLSTATVEVRWRPQDGGSGGMGLNLSAENDGGTKYLQEWESGKAADRQSQDGDEWLSHDNNGFSRFSTRAALAASAWQAIAVPNGGSTLRDIVAAFMAGRTQGLMPFIAEGIAKGLGRLECRVRLNGETVAHAGVWIDLVSVSTLFERWSCGHTANAVPVPAVVIDAGRVYDNDKRENTATIIHVHGWNMTDKADGAQDRLWFSATMYKRLWWQGYKGRLISFEWPTNDAKLSFDESEFAAWLSGTYLAQVIADTSARFSGEPVYLTGHSQGNVVAAEALRELAAQGRSEIVTKYFAMQAAIPKNVWDGVASDQGEKSATAFAGKVDAYRGWVNGGAGQALAAIKRGGANSIGNPVDYAMTGLGWSGAQSTKPDGGGAPTAVYGTWNYYMRDQVVDGVTIPDGSRLYRTKGIFSIERVVIPWNDSDLANLSYYADMSNVSLLGATNPVKAGATPAAYPDVARFEGMSFGAPGRWPSLGCVAAGAGPAGFTSFDGRTDTNYWSGLVTPPDQYKQHRWHSAQFRMNIAKQNRYWKSIYETAK